MEGYFFKRRKDFDLKANKYDLGMFFGQTKSHLDFHFLNKIVEIEDSEYPKLYSYHLTYYLETYQNAEERKYFEQLYALVSKYRTEEFKKNFMKMSPKQKINSEKIIKDYDDFLKMMKTMDKWGVTSSEKEHINSIQRKLDNNQESFATLKQENTRLKQEIEHLKNEGRKLQKKYNTKAVSPQKKVVIKEEHFATFVNLISELKEVRFPESIDNPFKNFFRTPKKSDSTWAKLISNNFSLEGEEITFDRASNYFKNETSKRIPPKGGNECKVEILDKKFS